MPRPDERPDDGLIHAWLDGELGAEEAARVERLVAEDAEWAAAAAEARGLMAASTRILGALDVVAGDVIPRGGSAAGTFAPMIDGSRVPKTHVTRWAVPTWMRVAVGVALVAGVGYLGLERSEDGTADRSASSANVDAARETRLDIGDAPVAAPALAPATASASASASASPAAPATAIGSAASPLPSASQTVVAPAGVTVATGVAGGIASGTVSRAVVESREARITAEVAPEREVRAKTMQRALTPAPSAPVERTLDSPSALAAQGARMADRVAESAVANTDVSGCWRARTTARVDSIQTSLRIIRSVGDTLVLALTPTGAEARVVRESDTALRGSARGVAGPSAAFRAERTTCAPEARGRP